MWAVVFAMAWMPAYADVAIVDGDTVTVDGARVHLHGIDAPVLDETCKTSAGVVWPCGQRARQQLAAVAQDDELQCTMVGAGEAVCRVAGLDIGALLVKAGLAKAAGDYQELEEQARAARVGIWE